MSYKIKFDDITSVQVESQKTMNAWEEAIASLNKAMTDFINNQNLQGQAISSMRRYLVEVHGTLLQTLVNLMNDYSTNLLLYKDGYYQIDSSNHAKLPGQVFTTLHSDLKSSRDNLKSEIEVLNTTKDKISDLVSYSGSSHTSTVMNYNFLMNQVKNLDNSIIQYESNHASQDLVAFKELLSATKALVAEHAGKTRTVGTYQSGDFAKLQSVQRFAMAYQQATKQMESRVERVQAAQERDKARFEALAAEDRAKNGWKDLAIGVVTVAIGALAIWATMGAATPLVVGAGLTAGIGTAAYGASNAGEGIHNIQLGNAGDAHTKSYNLIRDTLFMGNDKLYHDVGNVFVTASAIMIPIGQTQSVVKGLTQFAIGEAGAYTAGQVAYHGTKLLGGSEEDAQTANFIGNIVGGYVVSSAASKFSLNKVKVDLPSAKPSHLDVPLQGKQLPKLEPANVRLSSRPDLHLKASPADETVAKLKSHPAVRVDVPKVKQISGDNVSNAVSGVKSGDVVVPRVKDIATPSRFGDVGVHKIDSQSSVNMSEPSRLEYLHNKYGKISSEELHKRINTPKLKRFVKNYDPVEIAKSWQGDFPYTGVDEYQNILIKKGDILFAGEPFPTGYMVSEKTITDVGNNATKLFEGVQVKPYYVRGMDSAEYRKIMGAYKFNEDINSATGITLSNPQFGQGGLTQYFVPDFREAVHNKFIVPVKTSNIKLNNYKVNLSKYAEIEQKLHNLK